MCSFQRLFFFIFIIDSYGFVWYRLKHFLHVSVLFFFCSFLPWISWSFFCVLKFHPRGTRYPILPAHWTSQVDNTISYLLCVALDALVKRGAFKNECAVEWSETSSQGAGAVRVVLALPLMLQNVWDVRGQFWYLFIRRPLRVEGGRKASSQRKPQCFLLYEELARL